MEQPSIEKRSPILDQESAKQFPFDRMDQQWKLLTEAVRREILANPEARKVAMQYTMAPVNESLPSNFLDGLSSDNRIAKLIARYRESIRNYLKLNPVPEDQINPDISNAKSLSKPENAIKMLQNIYGTGTSKYYEELKRYIDSGTFLRGITVQEKLMIAQRYRFGRDVKLLALQAEVLEQGTTIQTNEHGEIILPSGTIINSNIENAEKRQELLNPQLWEKRRQLKDRVYEIQVGSFKYILKERKTARHTDTKKHGHTPGLTSLEEFRTAQDLQKNGVIEQKNIRVSWEKPVASVIFPDGFQFTIFEYENDLLEEQSVRQALTQEIRNHREQFEQEFRVIQTITTKFKDSPKVLAFEQRDTEFGLKTMLRWIGLSKKQVPELTYEDFAMIKALRMERQARNLLQETMTRNGYENNDHDGDAYKIRLQGGILQLEIFGFDFEYFSPIDQNEIDRVIRRYKDYEKEYEKNGLHFLYWGNGTPVTKMQKAGYFAMLESEGLLQKEEAC